MRQFLIGVHENRVKRAQEMLERVRTAPAEQMADIADDDSWSVHKEGE